LFEGRTGAANFSEELDLKESYALGTLATVFQAEVYAILACFDYCLKDCMTGKMICICLESWAVLLALSSHTMSLRLVLQCRNFLQGLSIQNTVQLFWVPGHCGIIGNEEAVGLVGVGFKSNFCLPEPCLPVAKSLKTRVTKEWLSVIFLTGIW
jgi:ribonuclease HI